MSASVWAREGADEELAQLFLASVLRVPVTEAGSPARRSPSCCWLHPGWTLEAHVGRTRPARGRDQPGLPALPEFLAELERATITDLSRNRYYGPEMDEQLRGLHISSCLASAVDRSAWVLCLPRGDGRLGRRWRGDPHLLRGFPH